MPLTQDGLQHKSTPISAAAEATLVKTALSEVAHECHEPMVQVSHEDQSHAPVVADIGAQKADCHDGTCQLCGVCHQAASLMPWAFVLPVIQIHSQPIGAFVAPLAQHAQPLIKPPIF
ncbi:MAG: hypothetical protein RLZZ433_61 [Pseudomonadota bacterium]